MEDARGVLARASIGGGGRGESSGGDGSRCACRTSTALSGSKGDFDSGGADGLEGSEAFGFVSAVKQGLGERRCGELRRGGGVGERGRRSREGERRRGDHDRSPRRRLLERRRGGPLRGSYRRSRS